MPDAAGKFKGFAPTRKTADAWERIFARTTARPIPRQRPGDQGTSRP